MHLCFCINIWLRKFVKLLLYRDFSRWFLGIKYWPFKNQTWNGSIHEILEKNLMWSPTFSPKKNSLCLSLSFDSCVVPCVSCKHYLYYKSWNNWKHFSPKLNPLYLSRRSHLSDPKVWRKEVQSRFLIEEKSFHPKCLDPLYLSGRSHLSDPKVWRMEVESLFW